MDFQVCQPQKTRILCHLKEALEHIKGVVLKLMELVDYGT